MTQIRPSVYTKYFVHVLHVAGRPHGTVHTAGPREAEAAPAGGWKLTILHHLFPPLASSLLFKTCADSK